jgi:hypothetical protein
MCLQKQLLQLSARHTSDRRIGSMRSALKATHNRLAAAVTALACHTAEPRLSVTPHGSGIRWQPYSMSAFNEWRHGQNNGINGRRKLLAESEKEMSV